MRSDPRRSNTGAVVAMAMRGTRLIYMNKPKRALQKGQGNKGEGGVERPRGICVNDSASHAHRHFRSRQATLTFVSRCHGSQPCRSSESYSRRSWNSVGGTTYAGCVETRCMRVHAIWRARVEASGDAVDECGQEPPQGPWFDAGEMRGAQVS